MATICKYLFNNPSNLQCQQLTTFSNNPFGQLQLSDNSIFMLNLEFYSPKPLHFYKVTFFNTSPDWAIKLQCSTSTCYSSVSSSVLSSSFIYTFFGYGNPLYSYMAVISSSTGSVSARYKSSISTCSDSYGAATSEDYVISITNCNPSYLLIFNKASNTFIIKTFSGTFLFDINVETTTGRLRLEGHVNPQGYTSKFMIQSVFAHPDFQTTATWTMNALSSGIDDILLETDKTIGSVFTRTVSTPSPMYSNVTVSYVPYTNRTSDVSYLTASQAYTYPKTISIKITPSLPCSILGSTSISFTLTSYNGNSIPSWVTINSSTGELTITTPNPASNTDFPFYISSTISGVSSSINKLITISVVECTVSFCQVCQTSDPSVCVTCNLGYTLSSNKCSETISESPSSTNSDPQSTTSATSTSIPQAPTSVSQATTSISIAVSATSIASIWLMINQFQTFFLLLLTRAYFPNSVIDTITGPNILSNPFPIVPLFDPRFYKGLQDKFYYEVKNPYLKYFKVNSISTIYNSFSVVSGFIFIIILHLIMFIFRKATLNCRTDGRCSKLKLFARNSIRKIFELMTFALYIRLMLELSQFFMVSCINEIYTFDISEDLKLLSVIVSILILTSLLMFVIFIGIFALSKYKANEGEHNKMNEFFNGLKSDKKYRFYVVVLMSRRLVFILLLFVCTPVSSKIVIYILSILQIAYFIYLILIKPFKHNRSGIILLINECFFLILLSSLLILNTKSDWTPTVEIIYSQIINLNSVMSALVIIAFLINSIIIWCRDRKQKKFANIKPIQQVEENQPTIETLEEIRNTGKMNENLEKEEVKEIKIKENEIENIHDEDDSLNIDGMFPNKGSNKN